MSQLDHPRRIALDVGGDTVGKIFAPTHKTPDLAKKHRKGSIWCPYCGEWRSFTQGPYGHKVCPECGISVADFWVKTVNNLWGFGVKSRGVKHDGA